MSSWQARQTTRVLRWGAAIRLAQSVVVLVVGVTDHHLVAEESGGVCPPVGDQGLGRRKFQVEMIAQELADTSLDLFGLLPGACEAEQPIVGLCRPPDYVDCGGERAGQQGLSVSGSQHNPGL